MKHVMKKRSGSPLNIEPLEARRVLAALFPAYVDGEFTLGDPTGSNPYGLEYDVLAVESAVGIQDDLFLL